jgi:hypothetical protein
MTIGSYYAFASFAIANNGDCPGFFRGGSHKMQVVNFSVGAM